MDIPMWFLHGESALLGEKMTKKIDVALTLTFTIDIDMNDKKNFSLNACPLEEKKHICELFVCNKD